MKHESSSDNEEEIVALIAQQQTVLRALIRSMVPVQADCDDILQETNLVLWRKRDSFEIGTNFNAWAGTIARFQVMAWRKRRATNRVMSFENDVLEKLVDRSVNQWGDLSERREALQKCLAQLPAKQRSVIEHRYFKKTPMTEYAKETGRSFAAVRKALERIRVSLRDCINHRLKGGPHET